MSNTREYMPSISNVELVANGRHSDAMHVLQSETSPGRTHLPEIGWIDVSLLRVDHSYQHRPYTSAIEDLRKRFNPAYSGFILVNIRTDKSMWIIDGQTRRAVHEALKLRWIRAEILRNLSDTEEARIYLIKCLNTQRVPVDFFLAEFKAGDPTAVLLYEMLKSRNIEVESYATEHQHHKADAVLSCVATLKRLLRRDPEANDLAASLDLIIDTWGYHKSALAGQFIETIHGLVQRYGDDIDRKSFIAKLSSHSISAIHDMSRALRAASTPQMTLRAATQRKLVELYNVGRQVGRLHFGA